MLKCILAIIGLIGFVMCLNEQPAGDTQNWWVNFLGLGLFSGSVMTWKYLTNK